MHNPPPAVQWLFHGRKIWFSLQCSVGRIDSNLLFVSHFSSIDKEGGLVYNDITNTGSSVSFFEKNAPNSMKKRRSNREDKA